MLVPSEQTVSFQIAMALRAHRNLMAVYLAALEPPLYVGQELILGQLWCEEGLTQVCLAGRVGVDTSTLTKALQRLERYGLIERQPDQDDTRVLRVFLTDQGRALEPIITAIWNTLEQQTMAGFNTDEAAQLSQYLARIKQNLA